MNLYQLYNDILQYLLEDRLTNELHKIEDNEHIKDKIEKRNAKLGELNNKFDAYPNIRQLIPSLSEDQAIKKYLGNADPASPIEIRFEDKNKYFSTLNKQERDDLEQKYIKSFKFAKFVYDGIENPDSSVDNTSMLHEIAYKITI